MEVGGPGTLAQSIRAARVGGHISLIGVLTGRAGAVPTAMLMTRQQRLQGLIVGSRRHQLDLIRGIDAVHGHPVIDRSFPLAEIVGRFPVPGVQAAISARSSSNSDKPRPAGNRPP